MLQWCHILIQDMLDAVDRMHGLLLQKPHLKNLNVVVSLFKQIEMETYVILELVVHGFRHGHAFVKSLLSRFQFLDQTVDLLLNVLRQLLLLSFAKVVIGQGSGTRKLNFKN